MTYQIGRTYTLCGMEMTMSYWDGDCPVFSYYVDKKEFLYRDNELRVR